MSDIVERLRLGAKELAQYHLEEDVLEAADEIERLRSREETEAPVRELIREDARNDALEEAAQVADPYGWCGYGKEICGPKIATTIRALKGDKHG